MQFIYPDLYRLDDLNDDGAIEEDGILIPQPPKLQLSFENISCEIIKY